MSAIDRFFGGAVVALALLLGTSTAASAGFIFTAQNRSVSGSLGGSLPGGGSQTITAPAGANFGVFDATVDLTTANYGGAANRRQRSELLPLAITILGTGSCSPPAMVGTGVANTQSYTSVSFDLTDAATEVTLDASGVASSFGGIPIHVIRLTGPNATTLVNWDAFNSGTLFPQGSVSRSTTLTLGPGSYQFLVDMQSATAAAGGGSNNHSVGNFNVAMTIPEPTGVALITMAALTLTTSRFPRRYRVVRR